MMMMMNDDACGARERKKGPRGWVVVMQEIDEKVCYKLEQGELLAKGCGQH